MSKKAKEEQGYQEKPIQPMCSNCAYYQSVLSPNGYGFVEEKEKRCAIGGFAVKKMATCKKHSLKVQE